MLFVLRILVFVPAIICFSFVYFGKGDMVLFYDLFDSDFGLLLFPIFANSGIERSYSSQISSLNIQWFSLDSNGFIRDSNESLQNKAAIYIYQFISDEAKVYIGSSYDLLNRFNQHRTLANSRSTACPIFYNTVIKYGWNNFRFGILEYIDLDLHSGGGSNIKKKIKKLYLKESNIT
jgi:hypothetical protein